jgi:hypothetical protein
MSDLMSARAAADSMGPVVGVAKSGWSLDQFCDYAVA